MARRPQLVPLLPPLLLPLQLHPPLPPLGSAATELPRTMLSLIAAYEKQLQARRIRSSL